MGVRAQQIQKYENGRDRISSSRLFLLAIALRVPVSFFFVGLTKPTRIKASLRAPSANSAWALGAGKREGRHGRHGNHNHEKPPQKHVRPSNP